MKECNARQNNLLLELSSWCLQDLGTKVNRKKIETLVTIHVHQKDVSDSASELQLRVDGVNMTPSTWPSESLSVA